MCMKKYLLVTAGKRRKLTQTELDEFMAQNPNPKSKYIPVQSSKIKKRDDDDLVYTACVAVLEAMEKEDLSKKRSFKRTRKYLVVPKNK